MAVTEPSDPQFESRVREGFHKQRLMATLGAELRRVSPGEVVISLPIREGLTQQTGYLHAGAIAAVLDSACGFAAFTLMPAGSDVVSIEFKQNLLAPAVGDRLEARAKVIRAGRTISVVHADGVTFADGREKLVATMTGTMMCVR